MSAADISTRCSSDSKFIRSAGSLIAIAHRLSTLHKASRLFVMKDGRLAESGTHEELLDRPDGIYRRLHELQMQLQTGI